MHPWCTLTTAGKALRHLLCALRTQAHTCSLFLGMKGAQLMRWSWERQGSIPVEWKDVGRGAQATGEEVQQVLWAASYPERDTAVEEPWASGAVPTPEGGCECLS